MDMAVSRKRIRTFLYLKFLAAGGKETRLFELLSL